MPTSTTIPTQTPLQGLSLTPSQPPTQSPVPQFDPQKLADIHLPEAISNWPVAPGWWILLALTIVIILLLLFLKIRSSSRSYKNVQRFKHLKSQAQLELKSIEDDYKQNNKTHNTVKQISIFLRRYALSLYPRDEVASLTDEQWLKLLDALSDSDHFSQKYSELLIQVPYQSENTIVDTQLLAQLIDASRALIQLPFNQTHATHSALEARHV